MNKLKAFLTLLFSALGVFGANEYYKPRNIKDLLKWRGVKLSSDDKVGDSMFYENKDDLKALNILDAKALGTGCSEKFKVTNLNDEVFNETKKYCSDSATSIMGRIIREGEDKRIIKEGESDALKINYLLASNKEEINKLLQIQGSQDNLEQISEKLGKGCKSQERVKVLTSEDKDKLGNFKRRCYNLKVKKFSDLLAKQGRRVIRDESEFRRKFNDENLRYATELRKEISDLLEDKNGQNGGKNKITSYLKSAQRDKYEKLLEVQTKFAENTEKINNFFIDEYGGMIFRFWCQSRIDKPLITEEMNLDNFNKFNFRCSVENK